MSPLVETERSVLMYKSIIQAPLQIQEDNLVAVRVSPRASFLNDYEGIEEVLGLNLLKGWSLLYIRDKLYVFERFLANNASRD